MQHLVETDIAVLERDVDKSWEAYLSLACEVDHAAHVGRVAQAAFNLVLSSGVKDPCRTDEFVKLTESRNALQKAIDSRNQSLYRHNELFTSLWRAKDRVKLESMGKD